MSDDLYGDGSPEMADDDLGEPIAELDELEVETSQGFLRRLRGKLERRRLGTQFFVLSWELPKIVVVEFVKLAFEIWSSPKGDRK